MGSKEKINPMKTIQLYLPMGIAVLCILGVFYLYREVSKTKKQLKDIDSIKENVSSLKNTDNSKNFQILDNRIKGIEQYLSQIQNRQPSPQQVQPQRVQPQQVQPQQVQGPPDEHPVSVDNTICVSDSDSESEIELPR